MAPTADAEEMERSTSREEEFTTPKSAVEQAQSPAQSAVTDATADSEPYISGSDAASHVQDQSDVNMSDEPSPQEANITDSAANESATATNTTAINAGSSANDPDNQSHPNNSAIAPLASTVASSSPSTHPQQTPSETRALVSSSPALVTNAATSNTPKSIKIEKDLARLKEAIEDASPEALHKVLRQEWRVFLFMPFDEDHASFVLRAGFKNANTTVVDRGIKEALSHAEFRPIILHNALKHVTAEQLLTHAPQHVMDEAIVKRLRVAPAQTLVNWLSDASRLGYSMDDYIDEDEDVMPPDSKEDGSHPEHRSVIRGRTGDVVMSEARYHPGPRAPHYQDMSPAIRDSLLLEQERKAEIQRQKLIIKRQEQEIQKQTASGPSRPASTTNGDMANGPPFAGDGNSRSCPTCGFLSPTQKGYAYHVTNMPCRKEVPRKGWAGTCQNCAQAFTTNQGLAYHELKQVCLSGSHDPNDVGIPELRHAVRIPPLSGSEGAPSPRSDGPPFVPARPNFSTAPRPSTTVTAPAQVQLPKAGPLSVVQIQRPPLYTPAPLPAAPQYTPQVGRPRKTIDAPSFPATEALQELDPEARVSPSKLPPEKKAEMERKIAAEDQRYHNALAAINPQLPLKDQEKRRVSLKNGNATKKSQIRRSFGVTLRMREKDKAASRAVAMASSPAAKVAPTSGASHSSSHVASHVSTPSSGFSPINGPAPRHNLPPPNPNGFGPGHRLTPPILSHRPGPYANVRDANPPSMKGFGVLRTHQGPPRSYQEPTKVQPNKRQRTSSTSEQSKAPVSSNWIPPPSRTQTPYGPASSGAILAMQDVSSEDAASKYPKKVPVGAAQAKWEQLQPKNRAEQNGLKRKVTEDADPSVRSGSNIRQEPVEIDTSSESEEAEDIPVAGVTAAASKDDGVADADRPLPSTEDTESEVDSGASPPTSSGASRLASSGGPRGAFMAKRGGVVPKRGGRH